MKYPANIKLEYCGCISYGQKLQSAVTRGEPTEYIEARNRFQTRQRELAAKNSKLREEIYTLNGAIKTA